MREGIYWRGSNRGRLRQREWNPNQSLVLLSGRQNCGRAAVGLVMCLILWFVAWTRSMFWTSFPISIESLTHQVPARAVVLELFRYYRHPQAHNRSFTASASVRRRRRGHLEVSETLDCTRTQIFVEERPSNAHAFDDNLTRQSRKRKGRNCDHDLMACSQGSLSSTPRALGQLPLSGGQRVSEGFIESFFVIVPLGYGTNMKEYFLDIDTGSGTTWVNCKGRGPMVVGPNGLLHPRPRSFLNCKVSPELCENFQGAPLAKKYPCDKSDKFRCLFEFEYGDDTAVKGSVILEEVNFKMSDGSRLQTDMAFGCADQRVEDVTAEDVDWGDHHPHPVEDVDRRDHHTVEDDDTDSNQEDEADDDNDEEQTFTDGLLGLGPHPASWLRQLNLLGIISEYVLAVCFEPVLGHMSQGPGSSLLEVVGFISFGDSMRYTRQVASAAWTGAILPESSTNEEFDTYFAKLVGIKYREEVHLLQEPEPRRRGAAAASGVQMCFDTGSVTTSLTGGTFDLVLKILDLDATRMGYVSWPYTSGRRKCWRHKSGRKTSSVSDFGDLTMMFSSLASDGTTSDLVIKPDYYITSMYLLNRLLQGNYNLQRTCFNIRLESEFEYGILGAESMRGHLFIFHEQHNQIGWSPVTSCKEI